MMHGTAAPDDRLRAAGAKITKPRQSGMAAEAGMREAPDRAGREAARITEPKPLELIDPRAWTARAKPRRWIVPDWIPRGVVTALYRHR